MEISANRNNIFGKLRLSVKNLTELLEQFRHHTAPRPRLCAARRIFSVAAEQPPTSKSVSLFFRISTYNNSHLAL